MNDGEHQKTVKNNQWELEGDCSKCRRASYCGSGCKASKKRMYRKVSEAINKTKTGKLINQVNAMTKGVFR